MEKAKDSFQFSRKDIKREAKTNLKHHYLMYVVACLFSLIIQAEFLTSDNIISVRRQVVSDAIEAAYELTGADDVKKIEKAYKDCAELRKAAEILVLSTKLVSIDKYLTKG